MSSTAYFVVFLDEKDHNVIGRGIYSEEHPTTTGSIISRLICKMKGNSYQEASDNLKKNFNFESVNTWKWKNAN